jgi:hypothetical protein
VRSDTIVILFVLPKLSGSETISPLPGTPNPAMLRKALHAKKLRVNVTGYKKWSKGELIGKFKLTRVVKSEKENKIGKRS